MPRAVTATGLLAIAVVVTQFAWPFLSRERQVIESAAQPGPLTATALIDLAPGARACLDNVTLTSDSARAVVRVGTYGKPAQPLRFAVRGQGYSHRAAVPPTYADSVPVEVPLARVGRDRRVTACVANAGRHKVALYASEDVTKTRSVTQLDGRPVNPNFELSFVSAGPQTLVERLPEAIERMAVLRPEPLGPWILWSLAVLAIIGVPAITLWALAASVRSE